MDNFLQNIFLAVVVLKAVQYVVPLMAILKPEYYDKNCKNN